MAKPSHASIGRVTETGLHLEQHASLAQLRARHDLSHIGGHLHCTNHNFTRPDRRSFNGYGIERFTGL